MCKRINYIVGVIIFRQPRRTKHVFLPGYDMRRKFKFTPK